MPILAGPASPSRLLGPDANNRLVYVPSGGTLRTAAGETATVYADTAGTLADILADVGGIPGAPIAGSQLTVGTDSQLPQFWYPSGADTVYVSVGGGELTELHADYDARIDTLSAQVAAAETTAGAQAKVNAHAAQTTAVHGIANTALLETTAGAQAKADAARVAAIAGAPVQSVAGHTGVVLLAAADVSGVETPSGAQSKANAAQAAAIAASDPLGSAATAQAAAATDATTKAASAQAAAISAAATDATAKANTAQATAISTASADATSKANTAQANAISTAATDATTKANAAIGTAAGLAIVFGGI